MSEIAKFFEQANRATEEGNFPEAISAYKQIITLSNKSDQAYHLSCWGIDETKCRWVPNHIYTK